MKGSAAAGRGWWGSSAGLTGRYHISLSWIRLQCSASQTYNQYPQNISYDNKSVDRVSEQHFFTAVPESAF